MPLYQDFAVTLTKTLLFPLQFYLSSNIKI